MKKNIKELSDRKAMPTAAGGDCAFHAVFGKLNGGAEYACSDEEIVELRAELRSNILYTKNNSNLRRLIIVSILELLISNKPLSNGSHLYTLRNRYRNFLAEQKGVAPQVWMAFEKELKKSQKTINYIEENHTLPDDTLQKQFLQVLSYADNKLRQLIAEKYELEIAFKNYNEVLNAEFDLEGYIASHPHINIEYANFIGKKGQWLLTSEVAIIAEVFKIKIYYYLNSSVSNPMVFIPSQEIIRSVAIQFNGHNHFERILMLSPSSKENISDSLIKKPHKKIKKNVEEGKFEIVDKEKKKRKKSIHDSEYKQKIYKKLKTNNDKQIKSLEDDLLAVAIYAYELLKQPYTDDDVSGDSELAFEDKILHRPNHGLAHTLRKVWYVPALLEYFKLNAADKGFRNFCNDALNYQSDDLLFLQCLMCFSVTGRKSEVSFTEDPVKYREYRQICGEQFSEWARTGKMSPAQIAKGQELLRFMHDPGYLQKLISTQQKEKTYCFHIMCIAHNLDLIRLYDLEDFLKEMNKSFESADIVIQPKKNAKALKDEKVAVVEAKPMSISPFIQPSLPSFNSNNGFSSFLGTMDGKQLSTSSVSGVFNACLLYQSKLAAAGFLDARQISGIPSIYSNLISTFNSAATLLTSLLPPISSDLQAGFPFPPSSFGENLTDGADSKSEVEDSKSDVEDQEDSVDSKAAAKNSPSESAELIKNVTPGQMELFKLASDLISATGDRTDNFSVIEEKLVDKVTYYNFPLFYACSTNPELCMETLRKAFCYSRLACVEIDYFNHKEISPYVLKNFQLLASERVKVAAGPIAKSGATESLEFLLQKLLSALKDAELNNIRIIFKRETQEVSIEVEYTDMAQGGYVCSRWNLTHLLSSSIHLGHVDILNPEQLRLYQEFMDKNKNEYQEIIAKAEENLQAEMEHLSKGERYALHSYKDIDDEGVCRSIQTFWQKKGWIDKLPATSDSLSEVEILGEAKKEYLATFLTAMIAGCSCAQTKRIGQEKTIVLFRGECFNNDDKHASLPEYLQQRKCAAVKLEADKKPLIVKKPEITTCFMSTSKSYSYSQFFAGGENKILVLVLNGCDFQRDLLEDAEEEILLPPYQQVIYFEPIQARDKASIFPCWLTETPGDDLQDDSAYQWQYQTRLLIPYNFGPAYTLITTPVESIPASCLYRVGDLKRVGMFQIPDRFKMSKAVKYDFAKMPRQQNNGQEIKAGIIYIQQADSLTLEYAVRGVDKEVYRSFINVSQLGIKVLQDPVDFSQLKESFPKILKILADRKHILPMKADISSILSVRSPAQN